MEITNKIKNAKSVEELETIMVNFSKEEENMKNETITKGEEKVNYLRTFAKYMKNEELTSAEIKLIEDMSNNTEDVLSNKHDISTGNKRRVPVPNVLTASILNDKNLIIENMDTTESIDGDFLNETTMYDTMVVDTYKYGFMDDVQKTNIVGLTKFMFYDGYSEGEASVLAETECMDVEKNQFSTKHLDYFSIGKYVEFSQTLKSLTGNQFISFFNKEIRDNMRAKLARLTTRGVGGVLGTSGRVTPSGILTELETNASPETVIEYDTLDIDKLIDIKTLLKHGKAGAKFYINYETQGELEKLKDSTGQPLLQDFKIDGTIRIKGVEVKIDETIPNGYVLYANPKCYRWNFPQGLMIETDKDIRCQKHSLSAYMIGDGAMIDPKMAVLLKPTGSSITQEVGKRTAPYNGEPSKLLKTKKAVK